MWAAHRAMSFIGRVVTMRCDPGAALRYLFPHMPQECEDQALTYSFSSLWTRQLWQRDSIRCYVVVRRASRKSWPLRPVLSVTKAGLLGDANPNVAPPSGLG